MSSVMVKYNDYLYIICIIYIGNEIHVVLLSRAVSRVSKSQARG